MAENVSAPTAPMKVFIAKVGIPFIALLGEEMVFRRANHIVELAFLPTLLALFYLSSVQVRPERRALRYRRFYFCPWKEIAYEEIRDCKVSVAPGLGVIKLGRFVPPWGRIYFVLEGPQFEFVFPGDQSALTAVINRNRENVGHKNEAAARQSRTHQTPSYDAKRNLQLFVTAVATSAIIVFFFSFSTTDWERVDLIPSPFLQLQYTLTRWPWNLPLAMALLTIVLVYRFNRKTLPLSVSLGALLGMAVARFFS